MKKVLILIILINVIFLGSCNDLFNKAPDLLNLDVPNVIKYEENTVYWNSVPNCDEYIVKINEMEYVSSSLSYTVSFSENTDFTFQIKAKGKTNYSLDSDWSSVYTYQYLINNQKNKLNTPKIESYDSNTNTIYWSEVENASGYCLKINGVEKNTNLLFYKFSFNDSCEFTLSIKALSNNSDILDSNWTIESVYQYNYIKDESSTERDWARKYGIGYGYNFIEDEYFNPELINKNESIIDLDKVLKFANISDNYASTLNATYIYGKSLEEYVINAKAGIGNDANVEVPIEGLYIGAWKKFGINANVDISSYVGGCFLTATAYETHKVYELTDFGSSAKLSNYLSDEFLNLVTKQNNYSQLTDNEVAQLVIDNYGTHMILGVITGAKLEYNYSMLTKDAKIAAGANIKFNVGAGIGIPEIVEIKNDFKIELVLDVSIANGSTKENSSLYVYGGKYNGNPYKDYDDSISDWLSGINDDNAVSLEIKKNGLISIYDIVYQVNPEVAKIIKDIIDKKVRNLEESLINNSSYKEAEKGSMLNPYLVNDVTEFLECMTNSKINSKNQYIKLVGDIDFSNKGQYNKAILPILYANIIGNDKNISGINMTLKASSDGKYGLFEELAEGASISNANFVSNSIQYLGEEKLDCTYYIGFVCGINNGKIYEVNVSDSNINVDIGKVGEDYNNICHIGSICGINKKLIYGCNVTNSIVKGKADTRGHLGANASYARCYVGGISGSSLKNSSIEYCSVKFTTIDSKTEGCNTFCWSAQLDAYSGGIVGLANGASILNSISYENTITASATGAASNCQRFNPGDICGKNESSTIN